MRQHEGHRDQTIDNIPRVFYRPDSHCSEQGDWYFYCPDSGEVGPFDSRQEAKEALDMSLLMSQPKKKAKTKSQSHQQHKPSENKIH